MLMGGGGCVDGAGSIQIYQCIAGGLKKVIRKVECERHV